MQIPENLPQFKDNPALLLVCGSQSAKVYLAHNSEIEELDSLKVEDPEYTDREGHFKRSGDGKTYGSGSVYEAKDEIAHTEFLNVFVDVLKKELQEIEFKDVILFSPSHVKKTITSHLPHEVKKAVTHDIEGNYVKQHPKELLVLIKKHT